MQMQARKNEIGVDKIPFREMGTQAQWGAAEWTEEVLSQASGGLLDVQKEIRAKEWVLTTPRGFKLLHTHTPDLLLSQPFLPQ